MRNTISYFLVEVYLMIHPSIRFIANLRNPNCSSLSGDYYAVSIPTFMLVNF